MGLFDTATQKLTRILPGGGNHARGPAPGNGTPQSMMGAAYSSQIGVGPMGGMGPMQDFLDPMLQNQYNPTGIGGATLGMGGPEPTGYLKELMRSDDFRDDLFHELRGDLRGETLEGRPIWIPNAIPLGLPGGPVASDIGIRMIIAKFSYFLSKFTTHGALTIEQGHGYAFEAANEQLYFEIINGDSYAVQRWAWQWLILQCDVIVYTQLSRTIGGAEAKRIAGTWQAREYTGGPFDSNVGSGLDKFPHIKI